MEAECGGHTQRAQSSSGIPVEMCEAVILKPGNNCWRIEHAERVILLVDGAAYFHAFRETVKRAWHSTRLLAEHLVVAPSTVAEALSEHRSIIRVIETLGGSGRTLRPFESTVPGELDALVPDAQIAACMHQSAVPDSSPCTGTSHASGCARTCPTHPGQSASFSCLLQ
jgi:hypothetical protein